MNLIKDFIKILPFLSVVAYAGLMFKNDPELKNMVAKSFVGTQELPDSDDIICKSKTHASIISGDNPIVNNKKFSSKYINSMLADKMFSNRTAIWNLNAMPSKDTGKMKELAALFVEIPMKLVAEYRKQLEDHMKPLFEQNLTIPPFLKEHIRKILAKKNNTDSIISKVEGEFKKGETPVPKSFFDGLKKILLESQRNYYADSSEITKLLGEGFNAFEFMLAYFQQGINTKTTLSAILLDNYMASEQEKEGGFFGFGGDVKYMRSVAQLVSVTYGQNSVVAFTRTNVEAGKSFAYSLRDKILADEDKAVIPFPEHSTTTSKIVSDADIDKKSFKVLERDIVVLLSRKVTLTLPIGLIEYLLGLTVKKLADKADWAAKGDTDITAAIDSVLKRLSDKQTLKYAFVKITGSAVFKKAFEKEVLTGHTLLGACPLNELFSGYFDGELGFEKRCIFVNNLKVKAAVVGEQKAKSFSDDKALDNFKPEVFMDVIEIAMEAFFKYYDATKKNIFLTPETILFWKKAQRLKKIPRFQKVLNAPLNHFEDERFFEYYHPKKDHFSIFADILVPFETKEKAMVCNMPASRDKLKEDVTQFFKDTFGSEPEVEVTVETKVEVTQIDNEELSGERQRALSSRRIIL